MTHLVLNDCNRVATDLLRNRRTIIFHAVEDIFENHIGH